MATITRPVKCALLNPQSVVKKTDEIRELINELSLDILVLCETWLKANEKGNITTIRNILPSTHIFHHTPRSRNIKGGGVGIFLSKVFTEVKKNKTEIYKSFEHLNIDFNHNRERIKFIVVYRPPTIDGVSCLKKFWEEIHLLLSTLDNNTRKIYICGDFNFWVDDPNNSNARQFLEIMDCSNYINHVTAPTAKYGHTLDLVLSNKDICSVRNVQVEPDSLYVHRLVEFELDLMTHKRIKKKITFRKKSSLRPDVLISKAMEALALKKTEECTCKLNDTPKATCCICLADCYNDTLKNLYSKVPFFRTIS